MNKLKVLTVVGTRPEIIRLSQIINKFNQYFDHKLIHTGQNSDFELNDIFFSDLNIKKPDLYLECSNQNPIKFVADMLIKIDKVYDKFKPDALLILGDTNSSLSAIAAKRKKIPIFHMEAGNRCFNFEVPEEINRRIVDVISDINLTYSKIAKNYLEKENFPPDRIIVTGSPLKEVIDKNILKIKKSKILNKLNIKKNNYFLISYHRQENVDDKKRLIKFCDILNDLQVRYKKNIILSLHPRTKNKLIDNKINLNNKIIINKPFGYLDYMQLQINSSCVFSDSGSLTEESSILNFKAINLRYEHERPEGFEQAQVMFTGLNKEKILNAYEILKFSNNKHIKIVEDYNVSNVSEKIARIVLSYTNFVNIKVWNCKT